jgi:hypothetical protein
VPTHVRFTPKADLRPGVTGGGLAGPAVQFWPCTTCYRVVRWRRAGAWAKIMALMTTSIVRVHQHGACVARNRRQSISSQSVAMASIAVKQIRRCVKTKSGFLG